ncbi:MAG: NUDIX domain-containing protein, partial [Halofilum sp. (in: g-proteobacteria)]
CGEIHYSNPRNIAGCIAEHAGRILLCRRAIEPRQGYWTVPAGFMENGETLPEAAARETLEEAQARTARLSLYPLFSLPHISQVYVMFRAEVPDGAAAAGPESLEVEWFDEDRIPWDQLAFPVMEQSLQLYLADRRHGHFPVHTGAIWRRADGGLEVRHEPV